jgi:hypothetical protein
MRKLTAITLLACATLLQACSGQKAPNIITAESLIDRSSERVTFSLAAPSAKQDITEWLAKDMPSRVELECASGDNGLCNLIAQELDQRGVLVQMGTAVGQPKEILIYERFVARSCDNRYKNNSFNPLNRNYAALGCSVSSNIVQSVSDSAQFTNPPMMGDAPANQAVRAVRKAQ